MRDLQKDLEEWITDHDIGKRGEWFYMTGEYIERAIKAEAEVAKYKRALELACEKLDELDGCYFIPGGDSLDTVYLKMAKAEEGER